LFVLLTKYPLAASLCYVGWHEPLGFISSAVVSFLYVMKQRLSWFLWIETSINLMLFLDSFSMENYIFGFALFNCLSICSMSVSTSFYIIKISSS